MKNRRMLKGVSYCLPIPPRIGYGLCGYAPYIDVGFRLVIRRISDDEK